jgi:hypothetical protein
MRNLKKIGTRQAVSLIKKIIESRGYGIHRNLHKAEFMHLLNFLEPKTINNRLLRIGGRGDGGYLVPNDLDGISLSLSPGSNKQWNFERDLHINYGIKSAIMDREENKPPDLPEEFSFRESWLGIEDNENFTTLEKWISDLNLENETDLLLQMDIEGAEYDILFAMPEKVLKKFRIMIIEFHYSNKFANSDLFLEYYSKIFTRLEKHFEVVHFHANNCCGKWSMTELTLPVVFEVTFLRKDRMGEITGRAIIPNELDVDCVPELPHLDFKFNNKI